MILAVIVQCAGHIICHSKVDNTGLCTVASHIHPITVCSCSACRSHVVDPEGVTRGSYVECVCLAANECKRLGSETIDDISSGAGVHNVECRRDSCDRQVRDESNSRLIVATAAQ